MSRDATVQKMLMEEVRKRQREHIASLSEERLLDAIDTYLPDRPRHARGMIARLDAWQRNRRGDIERPQS